MTAIIPRRAMVLAAGKGERLRPVSERLPKPLVTLGGVTLLDHALDGLARAGVELAVVNVCHLADQIAARVAGRTAPRVILSRETELLDTGGGVANALPHLGAGPFFIVSAKQAWTDGARPALHRLAEAWDDARMDALLLLQPIELAVGFEGPGDFFLDAAGRIAPRGAAPAAPYAYMSLQLVHPRLFAGAPPGAFSFWVPWRRALAAGRAFGLVHDGGWCQVSGVASLALAEAWIGRERV